MNLGNIQFQVKPGFVTFVALQSTVQSDDHIVYNVSLGPELQLSRNEFQVKPDLLNVDPLLVFFELLIILLKLPPRTGTAS